MSGGIYKLMHRGIELTVGQERDGAREWYVRLPDGTQQSGSVAGAGTHGAFRIAIQGAQLAIDAWLDSGNLDG